jgi:release factor glutamine methyltransferase
MQMENCTIGQLFNFLNNNLKLNKSDSLKLLSHFTNIDKSEIIFNFQNELFLNNKIKDIIDKLKQGFPLAYLINSVEFYGEEFYVDKRVLIPRPETELLVDFAINNNNIKNPSVLDICTGSGCILLSIINKIDTSFSLGIDISYDALNVAKLNSKNLNIHNKANFVCADVFDLPNIFTKRFDIILCNPPYVSKDDIYEDSISFEPEIALFANDKGLIFYKKILSIIDKLCNKGGFACFEIGANQREDLKIIGNALDKELFFIKDYAGNDRIMIWKNL